MVQGRTTFRSHRKRLIALGTAASLAAILLLCLAEHSEAAAFPGENGRIAFESNRDGDWDIYTMKSDGSDETKLTKNHAYDGQPAISPDGQKIAFISDRGTIHGPEPTARSPGNIYIMNSDGSGEPKLVYGGHDARNPAFSPDRIQIAFDSPAIASGCFGIQRQQISVIWKDGTNGERLTDSCRYDSHNPTFVQGGGAILFQGQDAGIFLRPALLWVHSYSRAGPRVVRPFDCSNPCFYGFSLDSTGDNAVYSLGSGRQRLWWGKAAGSWAQPKPLVEPLGQQDDSFPSFAPQGNWVAVQRGADIFKLSFPPDRGFERLTKRGRNLMPDWGPR